MNTEEFMLKYEKVFESARSRVREQKALGENLFIPLPMMFPHGVQDPLFLTYTKACRAIGYLRARNLKKVKEELIDIINYANFAAILVEKEIDNAAGCRLPRKDAPPS